MPNEKNLTFENPNTSSSTPETPGEAREQSLQADAPASIEDELRELHGKIIAGGGGEHSIGRIISFAIESGDLDLMEDTLLLYNFQPLPYRRAVENRWPLGHVDDGCKAVLQLLGLEDWEEEGLGEVDVKFRRAQIANKDIVNPDITITILRGTSQEVAQRILIKALERVSEEWDLMVRGESLSDLQ